MPWWAEIVEEALKALKEGNTEEATEILESLLPNWEEEFEPTWTLGNGVERNAANPDTFYIPEESERMSLAIDDHAKLMFEAVVV